MHTTSTSHWDPNPSDLSKHLLTSCLQNLIWSNFNIISFFAVLVYLFPMTFPYKVIPTNVDTFMFSYKVIPTDVDTFRFSKLKSTFLLVLICGWPAHSDVADCHATER